MAHILIVEDEEHIARMIDATLALGGHTSVWCSDGDEAPARIAEGHFIWKWKREAGSWSPSGKRLQI